MASKLVLTNLNLEGNEIQNVSLQKLVTDPTLENLKNGMIWSNTSSNHIIKYNDNGTVRSLLWSSGLGSGQTLIGGTEANGNLILQSTSNATKGSISIPEFTVAGFVRNDATGALTGGNTLSASDIPSHASSTSVYGDATKTYYGHVKIGDGIAVSSGIISIDIGTGLTLTGTSPNKKIAIDTTSVVTLTDIQTLSNKTLTAPIIVDGGYIADENENEILLFDSVNSAVNYIKITNSITNNSPVLTVDGSDTNINLNLKAKGTGVVQVNGDTIVTATTVQTLSNKTLTSPIIGDFTNSVHNHQSSSGGGQLDHGLALTGLTDDDHTQYLLLAGRTGGQIITGGISSQDNLTFTTTSNETKGKYIFTDLTASRVIKTNANKELVSEYIVSTDLDNTFLTTDSTLGGASPSDTKISTQKAIKTYVDNSITGLSWKDAADVATTGNITLSGLQTIDTVSVTAGARVLVKDQTNKTENGIYIASESSWTRADDTNTSEKLVKATVFIETGSQANTGWTCSNSSITEWSTDIEFVQFSGSGSYTGGTGIDIVGNDIRIDSTVVTLAGIQTLTNKTLTTPTLTTPSISNFSSATHNHTNAANGGQLTDEAFSAAIGPTKGGTGLTSYTLGDMLYSSSSNALSVLSGNTETSVKVLTQKGTGTVSAAPSWMKIEHQQTIGDSTNSNYVITHNLNNRGVKISVWRTISPYDEVDYYAEKTTLDTITLRFNRIILTDEFTVSVSI